MKAGLIDLRELLESGMGGRGGKGGMDLLGGKNDERERRTNRYTTADARMMLTNARALLETENEFEPGDFVRYKRGLEFGRNAPCGGVAIFLRHGECPYEEEAAQPGSPLGVYDNNCVIGVLLPDGGMAEYMAVTRYLEPCPDEEQTES